MGVLTDAEAAYIVDAALARDGRTRVIRFANYRYLPKPQLDGRWAGWTDVVSGYDFELACGHVVGHSDVFGMLQDGDDAYCPHCRSDGSWFGLADTDGRTR